ncbi:Methionine synthase [Rodentibacter pneumotropicus]|uniref:Methionine synthase n=1 Tax=Rodentibacter pneumotropicus TaxID=758 RepID=A0A448MT92_9PAST|nr:Methionine synthase [Rodentibacter pneumotropicus]
MLQCNNFEVIDLGVMVPADKIIQTAIDEKADIIGLSGLITPSLDEMEYFLGEMNRLKLNIPVIIGGATTSKEHTAIKLYPKYQHEVIYTTNASRAVTICAALMNPETKAELWARTKKEYEQIQQAFANKKRLASSCQSRQPELTALMRSAANGWITKCQHQSKRALWSIKMCRLPHSENLSTGRHSFDYGA